MNSFKICSAALVFAGIVSGYTLLVVKEIFTSVEITKQTKKCLETATCESATNLCLNNSIGQKPIPPNVNQDIMTEHCKLNKQSSQLIETICLSIPLLLAFAAILITGLYFLSKTVIQKFKLFTMTDNSFQAVPQNLVP